MEIVFVGDVGTEIVVDCGTDVSSATVRSIVIRKPNGAMEVWPAVADGTTAIKHVTVDGDLDVPGVWKLQAAIEMPGWKGSGTIATLTVEKPLS